MELPATLRIRRHTHPKIVGSMNIIGRQPVFSDGLGKRILAIWVIDKAIAPLRVNCGAPVGVNALIKRFRKIQERVHGPGTRRPRPNYISFDSGKSGPPICPAAEML